MPVYTDRDRLRLEELAPGGIKTPREIGRVLDSLGYLAEWQKDYKIQSVRSALHASRITCVDAAILSYGLLELLFPETKRRLLFIHRRDPQGEECGHCVTLFWGADGRVGAFSKSSFAGFGHREPIYRDEFAIAATFAQIYLKMKYTPLYYGVATLEDVAGPDLDWRFAENDLNALSDRLISRYEYAFE